MQVSYKAGMPILLVGVAIFLMVLHATAACNSPSGTPYNYTISIEVGPNHVNDNIYLTDRVAFTVSVTRDSDGSTVNPSDLTYIWNGGTVEGSNSERSYTTHFSAVAPDNAISQQPVSVHVTGSDWDCSAVLHVKIYPYRINYSNQGITFTSPVRYLAVAIQGDGTNPVSVESTTTTSLEGNLPSGVSTIEPRMNLSGEKGYYTWVYETGTITATPSTVYSGDCRGSKDPSLSQGAPQIDVVWSWSGPGGVDYLHSCRQQALATPNNVGGSGGTVVDAINPGFDETRLP